MSKPAKNQPAPALDPSLTAAHFTEPELRELRKLCRDAKNSGEGHELCWRYLQAAIDRAAPKPVIRPVDGMAG